jgi:hypothetical protein
MVSSEASRRRLTVIVRVALSASVLAFSLYFLNILLGKFAAQFGELASLRVARVAEFLLLFTSAVLFVIAALAAEARDRPVPSSPIQQSAIKQREE